MNQHHIQEAYLKSFEDEDGKLWVYPREGGKPLHRPTKRCTAEENFQSDELESFQNRLVETPGIKALRATGFLSESEYDSISLWMALHILRNQKSRFDLFESREDFDTRFKEEFEKELLFSGYYRFVFTYRPADESHFWLTSDNPVIEFMVGDHFVRCCAISPQKMILFSPINDRPTHELRMEDFFNAMVWASAVEYLFSHGADVSMKRLKELAETFEMLPVKEDIGFEVQVGGGEQSDLE
jgi:hypothetical protein